MKNILVTGGLGFIGSHLVNRLLGKGYNVLVIDAMTYAANLSYIRSDKSYGIHVCDLSSVGIEDIKFDLNNYKIDTIIHLAAESHVDNSIKDPLAFVRSNVLGTVNLLEAARQCWNGDYDGKLFYHVSTDEVFGALRLDDDPFKETTSYDPHSPYSASKASSDHFVRAYHDTYGLPIKISNCSNNYGPHQHKEKLIPTVISKIINNQPIPVYGTGSNIRDWLYVDDHINAIECIIEKGDIGNTYCIGGNNELTNLDLVKRLCDVCDSCLWRDQGTSRSLITFVEDRKGHDYRYAIDATKLRGLGWSPSTDLSDGLRTTVMWYLNM